MWVTGFPHQGNEKDLDQIQTAAWGLAHPIPDWCVYGGGWG